MEVEKNISGISENLSESIKEAEVQIIEPVENLPLSNFLVGVSISESDDIENFGLSDYHLKDISIEIARYLIVNGATILYGGDLRKGGYTEIFAELSYQYKYLKNKEDRLINYFPFPNSLKVDLSLRAAFKAKQVKTELLPVPKTLGEIDKDRNYDPKTSLDDRLIIAEGLSEMRQKMVEDSNARILIGGRIKGYAGYYPGIFEETLYAIRKSQPLFLIGGFGGTTKQLVNLVENQDSASFTNDFQFDNENQISFRDHAQDKLGTIVDYEKLIPEISQLTVESLSQRNGLTIEENKILFESTNVHEIVFLVMKGLISISKLK
jgi:hypothetical protein